jgi:hypothetical protein
MTVEYVIEFEISHQLSIGLRNWIIERRSKSSRTASDRDFPCVRHGRLAQIAIFEPMHYPVNAGFGQRRC